jgi:DNA-binding winged helix-turn-helix (wHTH) protein/Tol biopolymer transport system component
MKSVIEQPIYVFSEFRLDPARRLLTRNGETVVLNPKTFDLLLTLVENHDRVLSKNELLNTVWEAQFVEEGNIPVHISALRKIFGETKDDHRFIVTVPGRGYRFVSRVEYENHEAARSTLSEFVRSNGSTELSVEKPPLSTVHAKRSSHRNYLLWCSLGALLICGAAAAFLWRGSNDAGTSARPAADDPDSHVVRVVSARKVTSTGSVRTAVLSPDGKMFLYSSGKRNETGLWLGHVDGGEHIELRPPADAKFRGLAFAPDGESVYYVVAKEQDPNGALYRSSILGGVPEKLRDIVNTQITLAPDGKQFAYVRADRKANRSSLVVAEIEGANEREIASRPNDQAFVWETPSWSPDGKLIAVAAARGEFEGIELFVVTVEDGEVRPLAGVEWDGVRATEWLKDETGLLAVASEKDLWADSQIYHVSYPDGAVRHVNPDLIAYSSSLKLASDNSTLLTTQLQRTSNIWVAPADDLTTAKQITFGSLERLDGYLDLSWTADGKLIHSAMVGRAVTIWKTDPKVGKQQQLTPSSSSNHRGSTTDDGRFLVFQSNRSGSPEIWRSNVSGEEARQLSSGGENSWPHVSPNGHWIVFRKRDGFLWRMRIDGSDEIRITEQPATAPRFSPDSRLIACVYETSDEHQKIGVVPVNGGPPIKLFDVPQGANLNLGIRWAPDAKALTYRDWVHAVWRQDLNGGEPKLLPGLPDEVISAYDWSQNGKSSHSPVGQASPISC